MNSLNKNVIVFALLLPIVAVHASTQGLVYPVSVSENGRYFVDQNGNPVLWLGTTQWQIFREYTVEEARTVIERARDKGFVFFQAIAHGCWRWDAAECLWGEAMDQP